jgi:hypothetical protein
MAENSDIARIHAVGAADVFEQYRPRQYVVAPDAGGNAKIPTKIEGWVLRVRRLRQELRAGMSFARTVGTYQVYHDGVPVEGLAGVTVERQSRGDGAAGKENRLPIGAGQYPLLVHATKKYATTKYHSNGSSPRPALQVGHSSEGAAVLVHPAGGYGSTLGCINLAGPLSGPRKNMTLADSISRVIAVIEDLRAYVGQSFPRKAGGRIADALILIEGEPE